MMRNLQLGLGEDAQDGPARGHLPEHRTRAEVPPRGGNLFAHVGCGTISCGRPVGGMTVCLTAVILIMSFGPWGWFPGSLEIGSGATVLSGSDDERNWSQRYKANLEKLASGDLVQVVEVVRDLAEREASRGLSAGEKRMLAKARLILLQEG